MSREFTLAHRRWFDLTLGLKCLAKTRALPWPDEPTGATHRMLGDEAFAALTRSGFRLAHPHLLGTRYRTDCVLRRK